MKNMDLYAALRAPSCSRVRQAIERVRPSFDIVIEFKDGHLMLTASWKDDRGRTMGQVRDEPYLMLDEAILWRFLVDCLKHPDVKQALQLTFTFTSTEERKAS